MAKLIATVFVKDPDRHGTVILPAGSEPEPHLAALVTSPAAWEDGKPPAAAVTGGGSKQSQPTAAAASSDADDGEGDKPAAKKAARKPARGRAAGEGDSGS